MTTTTDIRQQVLEFAKTYPTPNVQKAVRLAEAGQVTWQQIYDLFKRSLGEAIVEVGR